MSAAAPAPQSTPSPAALAHSARMAAAVRAEIAGAGGWIPFARYMDLVLHAPGLGYYASGSAKFGPAGDFVTAPELSPLFARTLARGLSPLVAGGLADIVEFGAGTGALAATLLAELARLGTPARRYLIVETSAELAARQRERLAGVAATAVEWLDALPVSFSGLVIGNEVLDAMPVHVIRTRADGIDELGVACAGDGFEWQPRPAGGELLAAARALALPAGYTTEIGLAARAFVATLGTWLARGAALFIDYGFPAREYYHPQRHMGTLRCHWRHRSHDDPFFLPGLQDVTAHVDFSAIAAAARDAGLSVLGYTSQAQFLVNCGITRVLEETPPDDARAYLPLAAGAQKLLAPSEMGELFKVLAVGRDSPPLDGFAAGDRRHTL